MSIFLIISHSKSILYETTYFFAFGTRSVKIYKDGNVYDDLEIEEPNHDEYVIKSVYGVEKFDNYGSY